MLRAYRAGHGKSVGDGSTAGTYTELYGWRCFDVAGGSYCQRHPRNNAELARDAISVGPI